MCCAVMMNWLGVIPLTPTATDDGDTVKLPAKKESEFSTRPKRELRSPIGTIVQLMLACSPMLRFE